MTIKQALSEYIDACALIKDTREEIRQLECGKIRTRDTVKGSLRDYPYTESRFTISGALEAPIDKKKLLVQQQILKERLARCEVTKTRVEEFLENAPLRIQRIIRYKYFDGYKWEEVAVKMGGGTTSESVKKEVQRYIKLLD